MAPKRDAVKCGICKKADCPPGKRRCTPCAERQLEYTRWKRARYRREGRCIRCGKPVETPGHTQCAFHRAKGQANRSRRRAVARQKHEDYVRTLARKIKDTMPDGPPPFTAPVPPVARAIGAVVRRRT